MYFLDEIDAVAYGVAIFSFDGVEDFGKVFGTTLRDTANARHYRAKGHRRFVDLGETVKFRRLVCGGIQ